MNYYPKKPVKSFLDLEVYQKLLAAAVVIVKRTRDRPDPSEITKNLHECVLSLPIKIAVAHSVRFGERDQSIRILEDVMMGCNKVVVYLEQFRDLYHTNDNDDLGTDFFEEQIKNILMVRSKVFRLQKSWKKFMMESNTFAMSLNQKN